MNLYSHGVDPKLDFDNLPAIVEIYERCTRMHVYERTPYAGALVFAAFSGSHQDAIAKGMNWRQEKNLHRWTVPYIPIDPRDISRTYDADVIRVNSQSGKGGISYLLEHAHGYVLPTRMREHFGYLCKDISDHEHRELKTDDVLRVFTLSYLNINAPISVRNVRFEPLAGGAGCDVTFCKDGIVAQLHQTGNGSLDAFSNALKDYTGVDYTLKVYTEHSLQQKNSGSTAVAYVGIETVDGKMHWGAGSDTDITKASIHALLSAFNNFITE